MSDPAHTDQSEKKLLELAGLLAPADILSPRENDYFREVVESLPAAMYITDPDGVITYYNDASSPAVGLLASGTRKKPVVRFVEALLA